MRAIDVMTTSVIYATPEMNIREAAGLLAEHSISAAPVVDVDGNLVGIVSEGDLLHRSEIGTGARRRSWWLQFLSSTRELAREYVKEHAQTVKDVMTTDVMTVYEDTPLGEVAELLERHRIKRVPVLKNGKVTGIVSRANLVRALASIEPAAAPLVTPDDAKLREAVLAAMAGERWGLARENVIVADGVVHLWGSITSDEESKALCIAAQSVPGVKEVVSHLAYPAPFPAM
ncbi:CBS domain-containing protein [Paraburkholderia sp. SARCC-3016]|uniref:CBS domain-containing protein n=1 Tax=Paraburkholderia sp. SARCC-3016 TaxID=3058611 RepID=UPI002808069F|nr:CBS domain-containing protein [Paraburkholderia sp. SARCC-3016]MDQ7976817.1 CBS domain-containing protein [Paraburkholderia sp. SARCC-3016]